MSSGRVVTKRDRIILSSMILRRGEDYYDDVNPPEVDSNESSSPRIRVSIEERHFVLAQSINGKANGIL